MKKLCALALGVLGSGVLKVAIVRDANNLFVVLIQAPPPAA